MSCMTTKYFQQNIIVVILDESNNFIQVQGTLLISCDRARQATRGPGIQTNFRGYLLSIYHIVGLLVQLYRRRDARDGTIIQYFYTPYVYTHIVLLDPRKEVTSISIMNHGSQCFTKYRQKTVYIKYSSLLIQVKGEKKINLKNVRNIII
ncbi:hypothetical protein QTP88_014789 [Uroleucon formosanum]